MNATAQAPTRAHVTPLFSAAYQKGDRVKVNCYHGRIINVIDAVERYNPFTAQLERYPMLNPLYEVRLSFKKRYRWNERRVYIPDGVDTLKLFADEFERVTHSHLRRAA